MKQRSEILARIKKENKEAAEKLREKRIKEKMDDMQRNYEEAKGATKKDIFNQVEEQDLNQDLV